jgi:hypothetical protein
MKSIQMQDILDKLKEARSSEEITPKTWFYMVLVDVY